MTLPAFAFSTSDLFTVIRQGHLTDRGLFAGYDARNFSYVIADATFYSLEIFKRDFSNDWFTADAVAATASGNTRAVANGQIFYLHPEADYNTAMWIGEVIDNGTLLPGRADPNGPNKWYFGKAYGRTEKAYLVGKGNPSAASPPLKDAASSLLPIVVRSCPYASNQGSPVVQNGVVVQCHSGTVQGLMSDRAAAGKTVYGIHRRTNLLFFLVQTQNIAMGGVNMRDLILEIHGHGVEDAFLGDSQGSVYLIVDGVVESSPGASGYVSVRDRMIPVGLQLQLYALTVASGTTTFSVVNDAALAAKVGALPAALTNPGATLEWTAGGLRLTLTSAGGGLTGNDLLMGAQPVVLSLRGANNDLTKGATLEAKNGGTTLTLNCTLTVADPADPGKLAGALEVTQELADTTLVVCSATFEWPLA